MNSELFCELQIQLGASNGHFALSIINTHSPRILNNVFALKCESMRAKSKCIFGGKEI